MEIYYKDAHLLPFPVLSVQDFRKWYINTHKESISETHIRQRIKKGLFDYIRTAEKVGSYPVLKNVVRSYIVLNDKAKQVFTDKPLHLYKGSEKGIKHKSRATKRQIKETGKAYLLRKGKQPTNIQDAIRHQGRQAAKALKLSANPDEWKEREEKAKKMRKKRPKKDAKKVKRVRRYMYTT